MRLTHHAKNRARDLGMTVVDAEHLIANPISVDMDRNGKPRYVGIWRGEYVRVIVALDEPDLIVTIHPRRRP